MHRCNRALRARRFYFLISSFKQQGGAHNEYTHNRHQPQYELDLGAFDNYRTQFRQDLLERNWLNQTGAPIATQQKLMRHSSLAMTMDTYGTTFDSGLTAASSKVAERVSV
jgi:integrase